MRLGAARAESHLGRFASAADEVRSALRALATLPDADPGLVSEAHRLLSWILEQLGDLRGALGEARHALAVHPGDSREPVRAFALNAVGYYEAQLGMHEEALAHCTAAMRLLEHTAHRYGQADTWDSLGFIHARAGHLRPAARAYERAIELFRSIGARYGEADSSLELGLVLTRAGDPARARHFLETALRILGELRHDRSRAAAEALARLDAANPGNAGRDRGAGPGTVELEPLARLGARSGGKVEAGLCPVRRVYITPLRSA